MPDMDLKKIILVAALIAVAVVVFLVKEAINKKKGESGEDLAKVRQVIDKLLPGSGSYTTAYATYMSDQSVGNRISKYYYHYAIAFKPGSLFVVPIKYSGGEISFQGSGTMLTKSIHSFLLLRRFYLPCGRFRGNHITASARILPNVRHRSARNWPKKGCFDKFAKKRGPLKRGPRSAERVS